MGSRGLRGVQRAMLPLLGLGSVSDYCGARPPRPQALTLLLGPVSILERSNAPYCARDLFSLLRCAPTWTLYPHPAPVPRMPVQRVGRQDPAHHSLPLCQCCLMQTYTFATRTSIAMCRHLTQGRPLAIGQNSAFCQRLTWLWNLGGAVHQQRSAVVIIVKGQADAPSI